MSPKKTSIQGDIHEEYYQISTPILDSFPRFRLPLDLYFFKEEIARLAPLIKAEDRISPEQRQQLMDHCDQGLVFVSRQDHRIYAKHICKQLDLVLLDDKLKPTETALIFQEALTNRMEDLVVQPVGVVLERLQTDVLVLTEYLWADPFRIKEIRKNLWPEHTLARHSVNCTLVGLALYLRLNEGNLRRKSLDEAALGLLLHDLGMAKVPPFILQKTTPLTLEEMGKIRDHCWTGSKLLRSLDVRSDVVLAQALEHHERLDGKGYPQKLSGKQISVMGQFCGLIDSFCAMLTTRPSAPALPLEQILNALMQSPAYNPKMARTLQAVMLG